MNSRQYTNYVNNKETEWSLDEIEKLKLAMELYGTLNKERCEHIHTHVLPYKNSSEIQKKYLQLLNEKEKTGRNVTSPKMKSSSQNYNYNFNNNNINSNSPTFKSTVPLNNEKERSQSPIYWANN